MKEVAAERTRAPKDPQPFVSPDLHGVNPNELAAWLEHRVPALVGRWLKELQHRYGGDGNGVNALLDEFLTALTSFLPGLIGPKRDQVEPLWIRATELFGAVAARRGLAAGEVIDEFQILRETVIRLLYQDPPIGGRGVLSLRDVLRLNRAIDTGVTHSSVGHTDALFFSLFEGSGIPDSPPRAELLLEVREQLEALRTDLREVLGRLPGEEPGESEAS